MYSADSEANKNNKLYIGNLPFSVNSDSLRTFFETVLGPNTVQNAQVIIDRVKDRSKGFGFVSFASEEIALKAMSLNGQEIQGPDGVSRNISLDQARERSERKNTNHSRPRDFNNNYNNDFGGGGGHYNSFSPSNDGGWGRKDKGNRRARGGGNNNSGGNNNKKYDSDRW